MELQRGDVFERPYASGSFDHVFVCFLLEHLSRPVEALAASGRIEPERFDAGVRAMYRTTEPDGVFCYALFRGVGVRGS